VNEPYSYVIREISAVCTIEIFVCRKVLNEREKPKGEQVED